MSRSSSIMGKRAHISAPQPGTEATFTSSGVCVEALIFGTGLPSYGVPHYPHWYIPQLCFPFFYYMLTCKLLDIKADNIMFGIADDSVFRDFTEDELQNPCPRKELDGRTIYVSRELRMPREWGAPVLCDFGSAIPGGIEHLEDIQPNIYRAPEVILEVPWTYSVDIWNVGCMVRILSQIALVAIF